MASPPYQSTEESTELSWTKTHTVDLGTYQPGDHLVMSWGMAGSGGTVTAPAGWTQVFGINLFANTTQQWYVWIRQMDGSEGSSAVVATTLNNRSAAQVIRLNGARAGVVEGTAWDVEFTTSGYGTVLNPPSATATWGSADQTVIALGYAAGNSPTVSSYPGSYSNGTDTVSLATVMSATREVTAASEDPATFTISGSNNHRAATLILREAATVIAGAETATATATASPPTADPPTTNAQAETASATAEAFWAKPANRSIPSDLVVEVDWDGDGDFSEPVEDITAYVLNGSASRGRDYDSQVTGRSTPGKMRVLLDNTDGRFTFFNDGSPLNTDPFSTKGGRLVRLRTSESAPTDPIEIARDTFGGSGPFADADLGPSWTAQTPGAGWSEFGGEAVADGPPDPASGTVHIATVNLTTSSYYAQIIVPRKDMQNEIGFVCDWTDDENYNVVYLSDGLVTADEFDNNVEDELVHDGAENRDMVALGLAHHSDGTIKVYIDGVNVVSTLSNITVTPVVGLYSKWFAQRPPAVTEFRVWDRSRIIQSWDTSVDQSGVRWTGRIDKVEPFVTREQEKMAVLTATGILGQLDRPITAPASTGPDALQSFGVRPGQGIGNVLHRVGALHPPAKIDAGDVQLGSVGFDRQRAITLARRFEDTELGFLYETADGGIAFDDRSTRDGSSVVATFTDDPLVPGFGFGAPKLKDWQRDVINRVRSEVSPILPRQITSTDFGVTSNGVANDVEITIPAEGTGDTDAAVGDLLLVAIASTVNADGVFWLNPPGWTPLRPINDEQGMRVYARKLTAGDFGDTVVFYDDTSPAGGGWVATLILVKNWYGVIDSGVAMTEVAGPAAGSAQALAGDNDPPVMFTPWPVGSTLFLPLRTGIGASSTASSVSSASDDLAPDGFDSLGSHFVSGVTTDGDAAIQWARRIRSESVNDPSPFGGDFSNFDLVESAVIAVRGFAGDPPPAAGGLGVTDDNTASQLDRTAVLDHPNPGLLFKDETDAAAYNDLVLTRFAEDRPIVEFWLTATSDNRIREQVIARDLSDRIRIDADGRTQFGFDLEFFIESITDVFDQGATNWQVRYGCSPATDSGGGADESGTTTPGEYTLEAVQFEQFDTTTTDFATDYPGWEVYDDDNGNSGWGVRRPSAVSVVADGTNGSGANALVITATNGTGADAGKIVSGGVKLLLPQTYCQVEIRVRVDADPDEVTSGVVILWPTADPVMFPDSDNASGENGEWPAGGELDIFETFNNRDTRKPVQTFIHRLTPGATAPYDDSPPSDDDQDFVTTHNGRDGTLWAKYVFDWRPEALTIDIDDGFQGTTLTNDEAWIPDWPMELTIQLDPFPNPATPTTQPVLTGGNEPEMRVAYELIRTYSDLS